VSDVRAGRRQQGAEQEGQRGCVVVGSGLMFQQRQLTARHQEV